jgi:undecaprenyl-diphosphatase
MVLVAVGVLAVGAWAVTYAVARAKGPRPAGDVAERAVERAAELAPARAMLDDDRVDPAAATGVGMTLAAVAVIVAGLFVGVLALLIRRDPSLLSLDEVVERWSGGAASAVSDAVLGTITHFGDTVVVIAIGLAVATWAAIKHRSAGAFGFLVLVIGGQALIVNLIKLGVARARPTFAPRAGFSGASFPSGHSATAAACFLGFALVLAVSSAPRARAVLMATAVAIGVTVASTRVLLGVHWLSDALAGLAVGWAWYVVCSAAFGGRLLRYGAPVETATARVSAIRPPTPVSRTGGVRAGRKGL